MTDPRHALGLRAEAAAAAWLAERGWRVMASRWRTDSGELDLVCLDPAGCLVGVEVRLRSSGRAGSGAESIDRRRLIRLRRTLAAYAAGAGLRAELRIDLVTLARAPLGWRLEHHPAVDAW